MTAEELVNRLYETARNPELGFVETKEWEGVSECALVDEVLARVRDGAASPLTSEDVDDLLHKIGHIFLACGVGLAVQFEVR